ncbi:hypothetical protein HanRHA438_Chr16g0769681 [Helianthus annuus]|nr:hypothetical protein HanRHA438_Chr16g0769681 [Helianthus annuus]
MVNFKWMGYPLMVKMPAMVASNRIYVTVLTSGSIVYVWWLRDGYDLEVLAQWCRTFGNSFGINLWRT